MENLIPLLVHLGAIFALLMVYYFVPVCIYYYIFFIRNKEKWKHLKIQQKYPGSDQIRREIKYSISSLVIFSFAGLLIYESAIRNYTMMYFNISDYSTLYFVLSLLIYIFVNDTIFYWTHRFLHLKSVFRHIHLTHHKSTSPTPFAVFAFHPGEAAIHAAVYPLLVYCIPIHPIMFGAFLLYNLITNLAGHGGYEFMPDKVTSHWFFNWQNTITNHDVHHKKFNCNYGNYFIFWDKWMDTLEKKKLNVKKEKVAI